MEPLILIVEDNEDLLFNLDLILKTNNFQTLTAKNGKEAIEVLSNSSSSPDLILSDILMPKMNGYEFFKELSNDLRWHRIPFVFLSAKTSPKEIRLGKLLGVDDYITKPFEEKDLLATINGRIKRAKRMDLISESLTKNLLKQKISPNNDQMCLMIVVWDDKFGPKLINSYPREGKFLTSLDSIANQLFSATTSIYGYNKITKAEGVLINIKNINNYGYLYFDAYPDASERFGEKQFMCAIIAPKISYLHSLEIKNVFNALSAQIKNKESYDLEDYWEKINDLISRAPDIFQ
jgi:CheY-like chemotaxis protein